MPIPTLRCIALFLGSALLVAFADVAPFFEYIASGWFFFMLLLLGIDWFLSGNHKNFNITRSYSDRIDLDAPNPVTLKVQNNSKRTQRFIVRDEPPINWVNGPTLLKGMTNAGGSWEGTYDIHPLKRGDYEFNALNIRWLSPWGLVWRQKRIKETQEARVYPNMRDIRKYDLILRKNRLQELGLRRTRKVGSGTEFERLREYQPDDDYRKINWKATARRNKPIVAQYQVEKSQNVVCLIDIGRLMRSSIGEITKLDYVINSALYMTYIATGMGDRVGTMTFADKIYTNLSSKGGKKQFYQTLEALYKTNALPMESNYLDSFSQIRTQQRRRSLMIVFTDVMGDQNADILTAQVRRLSRKHLVLVVTISDPDIHDVAYGSPTTSQEVYSQAVALDVLRQRRLILERMKNRGVFTLDVPADKLSLAVIQKYLDIKQQSLL